jgi:hypothetical protein
MQRNCVALMRMYVDMHLVGTGTAAASRKNGRREALLVLLEDHVFHIIYMNQLFMQVLVHLTQLIHDGLDFLLAQLILGTDIVQQLAQLGLTYLTVVVGVGRMNHFLDES